MEISPIIFVALILGIVLGTTMLGVVIFVYAKKQSFGLGGSILTPFGVLLIGMSIWKTIDISVSADGGIQAKFQALEKKVESDLEQASDRIGTLTKVTSEKIAKKEYKANVEIDNSLPNNIAAVCTTSNLFYKELFVLSSNRHRAISVNAKNEFPCTNPDSSVELLRINERDAIHLYGAVPETKSTSAIIVVTSNGL